MAIKSRLPWGGHSTGMFMALAIERVYGSEHLPALASNALDFLLACEEAAAELGHFGFSPSAVELLHALRDRHALSPG